MGDDIYSYSPNDSDEHEAYRASYRDVSEEDTAHRFARHRVRAECAAAKAERERVLAEVSALLDRLPYTNADQVLLSIRKYLNRAEGGERG